MYFNFLIDILKYSNKSFKSFYLNILEYKFLLKKKKKTLYKNYIIENNKYKKGLIFLWSYYYSIKIFIHDIKVFFIQIIFNLRYILNYYYLYCGFYYYVIRRYISYNFNIIKFKVLTIIQKLNFFTYIKKFNFNKFNTRLAYSKVKYWYDYRKYVDRLKWKKKYIKNYFIYYNDKIIFYFFKNRFYKANYMLFTFIKKVISLFFYFKDSWSFRLKDMKLLLLKKWNKKRKKK